MRLQALNAYAFLSSLLWYFYPVSSDERHDRKQRMIEYNNKKKSYNTSMNGCSDMTDVISLSLVDNVFLLIQAHDECFIIFQIMYNFLFLLLFPDLNPHALGCRLVFNELFKP